MAEVTSKLKVEPGTSRQQIRCDAMVKGSQPFPEMDRAGGAGNSKLSRTYGCCLVFSLAFWISAWKTNVLLGITASNPVP